MGVSGAPTSCLVTISDFCSLQKGSAEVLEILELFGQPDGTQLFRSVVSSFPCRCLDKVVFTTVALLHVNTFTSRFKELGERFPSGCLTCGLTGENKTFTQISVHNFTAP